MTRDEILGALMASAIAINEIYSEDQITVDILNNYSNPKEIDYITNLIDDFHTDATTNKPYGWDWKRIFFKKVRSKPSSWMFSVQQYNSVRALCYGEISIKKNSVSINQLERTKSLSIPATKIAISFATAVANILELPKIIIVDPINKDVLDYYVNSFGMTPVTDPSGKVVHLEKDVS